MGGWMDGVLDERGGWSEKGKEERAKDEKIKREVMDMLCVKSYLFD